MNDAILVTGATGATGSALVGELDARGEEVRRMTRRPGPDTVTADFDDPESLRKALDGVRRAYLVTPSSERAAEQQIRFLETAELDRVVVLSQLAAAEDSPVRFLRWHARVERWIAEHRVPATILRPNLFLQGLFAVAEPIKGGVLPAPIGNAQVSAVDVRDVAAVAAVALTEPGHVGRTYDVTGPEPVTHAEIAAALAEATGHPVRFVDVPPADFAASLTGVLPSWQVEGLLEDYAHYARGEAAAVSPVVRELTGRNRTVREFVADHARIFG
jgi:uncharacterized protein YbjT (DUF2867 family)